MPAAELDAYLADVREIARARRQQQQANKKKRGR
jgi:hypothetical protein